MPPRDRLVTITAGLVRLLIVLNLLCAVAFAIGLLLSVAAEPRLIARLTDNAGGPAEAAAVLAAMRWVMLIGMGAVAAAHVIFTALRHLLDRVRRGDPFVPDAARQVERIGWALLELQGLDLCFGIVAWRISTLMPGAFEWQPSLTGWIAVLVAFVIARVFRLGTAMRDELAEVI